MTLSTALQPLLYWLPVQEMSAVPHSHRWMALWGGGGPWLRLAPVLAPAVHNSTKLMRLAEELKQSGTTTRCKNYLQ